MGRFTVKRDPRPLGFMQLPMERPVGLDALNKQVKIGLGECGFERFPG
jgi:hypothetical protein